MKPSIKTITLKKLISVAFVLVLLLIVLIAYNFQQLTFSAMIDKGETVANFVKTGLTTHMKVSSHQEKEEYKKNIQQLSHVENLTIIRSDVVSEQFHLPLQKEPFNDPMIAKVFSQKKPLYILPETFSSKEPKLRIIFPYIAQKDDYINCLDCHNVPAGTALGAIDFYIDVAEYKDISFNYINIILALLFILLMGILYLFFKIIDRHIKEPLDLLIKGTRNSFETHIPINYEDFESLELEDVAEKVNLFNTEVIQKNEELEEKNKQLTILNKEIEATQTEVLNKLGNISETRSKETAYHVQRVAEYSYLLAKYSGLSATECELIKSASPMHDIGKVGIPDEILKKPGKLTEEEFEIMKTHAALGYEIFENSEREMLKTAAIIAHEHHERWDGNGYPQKLEGADIHIYGRITALADVFDALISERVYKKAWPLDDVLNLFREEKGKQFDPDLVDIFFEHLDEFIAIKEKYQ